MRKLLSLAVLITLLITTCACGGPETTHTTAPEIPTEAPPTPTPQPTNTPIPTDTPEPTDTPRPTNTPRPTPTPTPLPEVEVLTGSGDSVLDIDFGGKAQILHITGNAAGRHFAVESYDGNGERIDLLVNTTASYDGCRPLDWLDDEYTKRLLITAVGEWTMEIIPLAPIPELYEHVLELPGTYEGNGDDLVLFLQQQPDVATIKGNTGGHYFGVISWGGYGKDLLVNTTDPYDGTKILKEDTLSLEVIAEGPWTAEITER